MHKPLVTAAEELDDPNHDLSVHGLSRGVEPFR